MSVHISPPVPTNLEEYVDRQEQAGKQPLANTILLEL